MAPEIKNDYPVCVDLDGTLIRGDIFVESIFHFAKQSFANIFLVIVWLFRGVAFTKMMVARRVTVDPRSLPYNETLLTLLKAAKSRGNKIYLTTAAHRRTARAIVEHLPFFDGYLATNGKLNLKAANKLELIQKKLGSNFNYIGDSNADTVLLKEAQDGILVSKSKRLRAALKTSKVNFLEPGGRLKWPILKALRPLQWGKNGLLLVPLLTSHTYASTEAIITVFLAVISFSLCASGVYLLNDILDISADRQHPSKKYRPLASGELKIPTALLLTVLMPVTGILIAGQLLPGLFVYILLLYLVLTTAYSTWLKQKIVVDVFVLAGLYTLRIIAGAAAIAVPISFWLLGFSFFIFLSLAYLKRYEEINLGKTESMVTGRGYKTTDGPFVLAYGAAAGVASIIVLAFFIESNAARDTYLTPGLLWLMCPVILYEINYLWLKGARGTLGSDPVTFALKNKVSWGVGVLCASILYLARYHHIPLMGLLE